MKPAPFTYHRAQSVQHAVELLGRRCGARVIAGGQSLIPRLNARLDRPTDLVDITGIPGLDQIRRLADGHLSVGAAVRHSALGEANGTAIPRLLSSAVMLVGSVAIRSLGTPVGSIAFADPTAEIPAVLRLLGGRLHLASPRGVRSISARSYLETPPADRLAQDEIITQVDFQLPRRHSGTAITEVAQRHGDRALAGAAASVQIAPDGRLAEVHLCLWSTTPQPLLLDLTRLFQGHRPQEANWGEAILALAVDLEPPAMANASASYRRHLAVVAGERALTSAARRARPAAAKKGLL
ncbi:FAD binding domain-containing protein [Streptomyces microflavus]|uniref:FAD binding domain-containing protein n=1 Tax=Streptomyces microflavus TaxID=1919 RepID=UPI003652FB7B